ncbi:MAG: phosphoribosylglycinamide formyltransferase [Candidatus Oxydemutatoraceae bacterium WSBS_2016_MAG_OTU14]
MSDQAPKLVVMLSGRGSNLIAISDAIQNKKLHANLVAVISNRKDAQGLKLAHARGYASFCIDEAEHDNHNSFEQALLAELQILKPDVIALAGFMRILSNTIIKPFQGKIINIHPSLLPKYKGLHTHRRVLEAGEKEHGCTTHFVTEALDGGDIILQARVEVRCDDSEKTLAQRVLVEEHRIYPKTLQWVFQQATGA